MKSFENFQNGISNLLIDCFTAAVIFASFPVIEMNMLRRSPAMGVQKSWIYIAIPTSMTLIFLISVERTAKTLRGHAKCEV